MAVQPIGGVAARTAPTGATAPAGTARPAGVESKDSTIVISKVTKTNADGSTITTITYADGHTKIETTPPKYAATEGEGHVTAVDILA